MSPRKVEKSTVYSGWQEKRRPEMPLPPRPDMAPAFDDEDMRAWQALNRGDATPDQQRRALAYLFWMTGYTAKHIVPSDAHMTYMAQGRRSVACDIGMMISRQPRSTSNEEQGQ